jgi:hypothetical protein
MRGLLQPDLVPSAVVTTGLVPVVRGSSSIAWIAGLETEVPAFAGMTPWTREIFDV